MVGTARCDRCWELESRIRADPAIGFLLLNTLLRGNLKESLVVAQKTWSYNHESDQDLPEPYNNHPICGKKQGDEPPCEKDFSGEIAILKLGSRRTHHAGAPGVGHVTYAITRIDEEGAWGIEIENTMEIPDADFYV